MNVNSPEFLQDPYRFYRQRREQGPLIRSSAVTWSVTGYEVMADILAHPGAGRGNVGQAPQPGGGETTLDIVRRDNPALRILENWMLFKNPPEHTRLRKLVSREFTNRTVAELEPRMRAAVRQLIDTATGSRGKHSFDLVAEVAHPFPVAVISELLGIPAADRDRFRAWTQDFALAVQVDFLDLSAHARQRLNRSADGLARYFRELVEIKRRDNSDDLVARLINAGEEENGLSEQEILANCVFLLFSGHETTTSLIANGVNALLENPEQYEALRSNPNLIPNTVEECLRYDPSIQMVGRYAMDDIVAGEHRIPAGDHIYAFLGAAGRDPAANPDPDAFDVARSGIKHLAFARGAHHCLGSNLARLEARVAFEEIVDRLPGLKPTGPGRRRKTWLMRSFEFLPVCW